MRGQRTGIGIFCRALIRKGIPEAVILRRALKKFPTSVATLWDIWYYRNEIEGGRVT